MKKITCSKKLVVTVALLALIMPGCASMDREAAEQQRQEQRAAFKRQMDAAVGHMTYDQALSTWGPPRRVATGTDRMVAVWGDSRAMTVYMPIGNTAFAAPVEHGWEMQLEFAVKDGRLLTWRSRDW